MHGSKVITVAASNVAGSVTSVPHIFAVAGSSDEYRVYLPIILKQLYG
jgi:hypothetical protein